MRKRIYVDSEVYSEFNKISNCASIDDLMTQFIAERKPCFDWEKFMECVESMEVTHEKVLDKISCDFNIKFCYIAHINPLKSDRDMQIFNALGFKLDDFMVVA